MNLGTVQNVWKSYSLAEQKLEVLCDVSLELHQRTFVSIQGASGSGKSTLLMVMGGLLRPDKGKVTILEHDVYRMSGDQRARFRARHIGFIFQQFHLVPYLNVEKNILAAALGVGGVTKAVRERADELIQRFGLQDRRRHVPGQLSTGERQRTALARALLNGPSLLLADEPTGNLDSENTAVVIEQLRQFADSGGCVVLVTHNENIAANADEHYHVIDHRLCTSPTAATFEGPSS